MPTKLNHQPIEGRNVRLRLLSAADIELTRCWRNQDHIRKWFTYSGIIDAAQQSAWFAKYETLGDDYVYVVEARHPETREWTPVGQISVYAINFDEHSTEYGRILVGEESFGGRGIFFEASALMIDYWRSQHGITNFYLEVKADNARAIRLYDRLGFIREGEKDGYITMRLNFVEGVGAVMDRHPSVNVTVAKRVSKEGPAVTAGSLTSRENG